MKRILVLGLGNEILSDDGIAPRLIKDLSKLFPGGDIDFSTQCCGGLDILERIDGYRRVILIDAIKTSGGNPGDVFVFKPEDFRETSNLSNLHDINFITALSLGKTLRLNLPPEINIIAVKIVEDMEFSTDLTPEIKKIYPEILSKAERIVKLLSEKPSSG